MNIGAAQGCRLGLLYERLKGGFFIDARRGGTRLLNRRHDV